MESSEERATRRRDERIRMGHDYPHPRDVHPGGADLGGIYAGKASKPSYPSSPGVSGVDTGLADVAGRSMYGHEHWELRKRRLRRDQRVKSMFTYLITTGCLVILTLLTVAAVLGGIILVRWLVSLL